MNQSLIDKKEIMIQGINYMVLNVIVNNFVTIEKSFFNNFIHNSEQGQVLLSEPIVLNPQLVQGLKWNKIWTRLTGLVLTLYLHIEDDKLTTPTIPTKMNLPLCMVQFWIIIVSAICILQCQWYISGIDLILTTRLTELKDCSDICEC